jgi:hypothetical protein
MRLAPIATALLCVIATTSTTTMAFTSSFYDLDPKKEFVATCEDVRALDKLYFDLVHNYVAQCQSNPQQRVRIFKSILSNNLDSLGARLKYDKNPPRVDLAAIRALVKKMLDESSGLVGNAESEEYSRYRAAASREDSQRAESQRKIDEWNALTPEARCSRIKQQYQAVGTKNADVADRYAKAMMLSGCK